MINKIKKRILGLALTILRLYFHKTNYSIFIFDRTEKRLSPFLWHPRYLPRIKNRENNSPTNDWSNFKNLINFENGIVFDVGAAIGATSRQFSCTAKKVYSFEPNLENYKVFNDIIFLERIDNIILNNFAVSNQNAELDFYNRNSFGIHSLGEHPKGKIKSQSKIKSITLDDFYIKSFVNKERISLLKIDTEGYEYEVLEGSKYLLEKKIVKSIIFEHSISILKSRNKDPNLIFGLLQKYGYRIHDYKGNIFDYTKDKCDKISDFLALAD